MDPHPHANCSLDKQSLPRFRNRTGGKSRHYFGLSTTVIGAEANGCDLAEDPTVPPLETGCYKPPKCPQQPDGFRTPQWGSADAAIQPNPSPPTPTPNPHPPGGCQAKGYQRFPLSKPGVEV